MNFWICSTRHGKLRGVPFLMKKKILFVFIDLHISTNIQQHFFFSSAQVLLLFMSIPLVSRKLIYGKCFALVFFFLFFLVPFFFFLTLPFHPPTLPFFFVSSFFVLLFFPFFSLRFCFWGRKKEKKNLSKVTRRYGVRRRKNQQNPRKDDFQRFAKKEKKKRENKTKTRERQRKKSISIPNQRQKSTKEKTKNWRTFPRNLSEQKKNPILGEKGQKGKKKKIRRQGLRVHPQKRKKRKCSKKNSIFQEQVKDGIIKKKKRTDFFCFDFFLIFLLWKRETKGKRKNSYFPKKKW